MSMELSRFYHNSPTPDPGKERHRQEISPLAATMRRKERCSAQSFGQDYTLRAIKLQRAAPAKMLLDVECDAGVKWL
jgi:hypothetical protein